VRRLANETGRRDGLLGARGKRRRKQETNEGDGPDGHGVPGSFYVSNRVGFFV
jgi:hypothetical protein